MTTSVIRIATRSSKLALWQAEYVRSLVERVATDISVEIVHIKTVGDRNQTDALRQFGGTGVFTREVQTSVLAKETDIAVHSLKDLPTDPTDGLQLAGIPDRAATADAMLLPNSQQIKSIDDLPPGSRIGTGSPRRQAQLLYARPDLQLLEIRGNVETRIRKLDDGDFDAIVLAEAGLRRLGLDDRISLLLEPPIMFTAVGQGAIGIECRDDDALSADVLGSISDQAVVSATKAERTLLATLRAGCHAPLGVQTSINGDQMTLASVLLSADGTQRLDAMAVGPIDQPESLGQRVAAILLEQGGSELVTTV